MSFDFEAARRVIREAEEDADDVAPGAVWPVIGQLELALEEIERQRAMLRAVRRALQSPRERHRSRTKREVAACSSINNELSEGRTPRPTWCEFADPAEKMAALLGGHPSKYARLFPKGQE